MATVQKVLQDWPEFRDSLPLVLAEARFADLCKGLIAQEEPLAWDDLGTVAKLIMEVQIGAISA